MIQQNSENFYNPYQRLFNFQICYSQALKVILGEIDCFSNLKNIPAITSNSPKLHYCLIILQTLVDTFSRFISTN
jgi:hypothetical protein